MKLLRRSIQPNVENAEDISAENRILSKPVNSNFEAGKYQPGNTNIRPADSNHWTSIPLCAQPCSTFDRQSQIAKQSLRQDGYICPGIDEHKDRTNPIGLRGDGKLSIQDGERWGIAMAVSLYDSHYSETNRGLRT